MSIYNLRIKLTLKGRKHPRSSRVTPKQTLPFLFQFAFKENGSTLSLPSFLNTQAFPFFFVSFETLSTFSSSHPFISFFANPNFSLFLLLYSRGLMGASRLCLAVRWLQAWSFMLVGGSMCWRSDQGRVVQGQEAVVEYKWGASLSVIFEEQERAEGCSYGDSATCRLEQWAMACSTGEGGD